ncbi:pirin family protein [Woodsholea maritima]|uniref:pirin family protein n=1 Tax=Woodsholea maritima TaxID=240237 RepID=UPI00035D427E|nr:pirin family protein [Woodsholea maritima]
MLDKRSFDSLGGANHGWLNAKHHFSFASYYDPKRMGWGALRVWNDDVIQSQTGFPPHPHDSMEIITYVRTGAISHRDSMGNSGRTGAGDVQVMSAGSGIRHSEYNLEDEDTTLFQIWIMPEIQGGEPRWDAKQFPKGERADAWDILASGYDSDDGALFIRAKARVLGASLSAGKSLTYTPAPGRHQYLVVNTGKARVGDIVLYARDGLAIKDEAEILITADEDSELIMTDTL